MNTENSRPEAPSALADRKIYDTPIGPVCMSRAEHEAYMEEMERQKLKDKEMSSIADKTSE